MSARVIERVTETAARMPSARPKYYYPPIVELNAVVDRPGIISLLISKETILSTLIFCVNLTDYLDTLSLPSRRRGWAARINFGRQPVRFVSEAFRVESRRVLFVCPSPFSSLLSISCSLLLPLKTKIVTIALVSMRCQHKEVSQRGVFESRGPTSLQRNIYAQQLYLLAMVVRPARPGPTLVFTAQAYDWAAAEGGSQQTIPV